MAATTLIAFTTGSDVSSDQTVAAGEIHTLLPITNGDPGKVVIQAKLADDSYTNIGFLSSRPASNKVWQINGPLVYRVKVKNAGCDVDTGG